MKTSLAPCLVVVVALVFAACEQHDPMLTAPEVESAASSSDAHALAKTGDDEAVFERIKGIVDRTNANLEAQGSELRLNYPWLFRVGPGTDPFARLRTGARWPSPANVEYLLDESDYTKDVAARDVESALVSSFDSWNTIENSTLRATRLSDSRKKNLDILDGIVRNADGECVDVVDVKSDNFDHFIAPDGSIIITALQTASTADVIVGGWLSPDYFQDCLGSASILGVTWSFSFGNRDGDNYVDRVYVEQYYNTSFAWTTDEAVYLNFDAPIDIETIAVHENGHAHGLGHFGGPVNNQPFALQPNGSVFNPEAVMNPFYIGGEERSPLSTDVAAIHTLYANL